MVLENGAKFMFVLGSKSSVGKSDGEGIYKQASRRSNLVDDAKILGGKQMKLTVEIIETIKHDVPIEVVSSHFFGLIKKVKVHYAATPLLSRKPFFVGFWRIKK